MSLAIALFVVRTLGEVADQQNMLHELYDTVSERDLPFHVFLPG